MPSVYEYDNIVYPLFNFRISWLLYSASLFLLTNSLFAMLIENSACNSYSFHYCTFHSWTRYGPDMDLVRT